jgi:hypothetical protein
MESFLVKLERAREHLQCLEMEAGVWIRTKPYGLADEPDPDPPEDAVPPGAYRGRIRITRVDDVPDHLSLLIGDCAHNLRSALDHLALALARSYIPNMTTEQANNSAFPIFYSRAMKATEERERIGCIDPTAQTFIKGLQPHLRGNAFRADPLWQIHELDRLDKHQVLNLCVGHSEYVGITKTDDWNIANGGLGLVYLHVTPGELIADAIFARYIAMTIDPNREVKMDPTLKPEVAFARGGPAQLEPVIPTLAGLCDFVRDGLIAPLSKYL